jgi:hypothetical protein
MNTPILDDVMFARGLVFPGLSEDMERFRKKLEQGESITYAAIGGSITAGASASDGNTLAYAPLFAAWLNERAPCRFINAGVGATPVCSEPSVLRRRFSANHLISSRWSLL